MTDYVGSIDYYHENALHRYGMNYPDGTQFAEELIFPDEDGKISTDRYISPTWLAAEIERVWKKTWQYVCRADDIPDAGSFLTYTIADQEFLVVRQADGSVKALNNVCLHRGNMLRNGCGVTEDLKCRFHHWAWEIDGSLKDIPDRHCFVGLDDEDLSLGEVPCDTWAGFVFLNPDSTSPVLLRDFLGPIVDQLAPYHFENMLTTTNVTQPLSCNWKTAIEAFLEAYHTMGLHPQLLPSLDDVNTTFEVMGDHSRMITPFGVPSMRYEEVDIRAILDSYTDTGGAIQGRELDPGDTPLHTGLRPSSEELAETMRDADGMTVREWLMDYVRKEAGARGRPLDDMLPNQAIDDWHYFLFPGVVMNINPMSTLLLRMRPHATDPDSCWVDVCTYEWPHPERGPFKSRPNVVKAEGEVNYGKVLVQDFDNLPGVQRGLHSDRLKHMLISKQEVRVTAFNRAVERYVGASHTSGLNKAT
ncbi:aromatic ring-hydroxylating oxygenase subunit alpha [Mycobacterium vicinigordonae]|uniref:Aromatic ring-hydroxylating dioxygenase subunit alpha n=1 Tax=Mycobacterium vicinigordonae TaxID=1719132 RepID=A0A7D6I2X0_9MYCO|nr:aromatic ring-hydroxylating dioxygenase subunit alpha [Mycobacterium vicinigordonae]QLL08714.1 aromatic ring-hydroxylating dioxygenase subunit alpha [Mycobacterium vicinigordonae]